MEYGPKDRGKDSSKDKQQAEGKKSAFKVEFITKNRKKTPS